MFAKHLCIINDYYQSICVVG